MAIELYWDDKSETVMLAEFEGKWTWDELYKVLNKIKSLSTERERIFGAILDLRGGLHLPNGSILNKEGLEQFQRLLALNDGSKKGPMVILGMNPMVKMVFEAVNKFDKSLTHDIFFADNEESARNLIYPAVTLANQNETLASKT